jgi:hypothetical protein
MPLSGMALLDDHHPHHRDHDYLWFLGVRPQWQSKGHGSALRGLLVRADRTSTATYLGATSPDNRRLYQRSRGRTPSSGSLVTSSRSWYWSC